MKILSNASKKNCKARLFEITKNKLNYVVIEFYKKGVLILHLEFSALLQNKAFSMYDTLVNENKLIRE